jgi:hypothetical protein
MKYLISQLPLVLRFCEGLPAGSADRSLLFLILNIDLDIVANTFPIPRVLTLVSIKHSTGSLGVVLVARIEEVDEGEEIRVTNGQLVVGSPFLPRLMKEDAVLIFSE